MRRILVVTLHFPPWSASSGYLRVLSFCRHLPDFGWEPIVLTAHPRAYAGTDSPASKGPTDGMAVYRAFAVDARVHLSIGGKYPSWLALPDRWSSWWVGGVWSGVGILRRLRPDVVFSTYPITTAHLIGRTLSRMSRLPWVADFRDPIVDGRFPDDTAERRARRWVEARTMKNCTAATFTTDGAREEYRERYEHVAEERMHVIPNGYEEATFAEVEAGLGKGPRTREAVITLVHSGTLYSDIRDPGSLFQALKDLKQEGHVDASRLRIVFRASGDERGFEDEAKDAGVLDLVSFAPGVGHREAVEEMMTADGLLLMQGEGANHQIPAKVYEYLRAGRPILALIDEGGDTAKLLRAAEVETVAQIDDVQNIKRVIPAFLRAVEECSWRGPSREFLASCTRAEGTRRLARVLDSLVETR